MERFGKTFSIFFDEDKDCAATRMVERLRDSEGEGRGVQVMLMRQWMTAGFLLEEIGRGLDTALVDMDQDGVFHRMTKSQQADILIRLIEQKIWQHNLMESAKSKSAPVSQPVTAEPEKVTEPEPAKVVKAVDEIPPTPPVKKKRRRPAQIVA